MLGFYWCRACWREERAAGATIREAFSIARGYTVGKRMPIGKGPH